MYQTQKKEQALDGRNAACEESKYLILSENA